jgi:uncharacterized membrane-anchored protein
VSQSRLHSTVEALTGTAVGFIVSVILGMIVYPLYGHAFSLGDNIQITMIFTVASVLRGYAVRRVFNRWHGVKK